MYFRHWVGSVAATALTLPALIAPALAQPAPKASHTFVYVADKPVKSVHVAGTFNNWNKDASPLKVEPDGRTWRVTLPLPYGKHQYKFVLDGGTWITDPAGKAESDGNGNTNSALRLLPPDYSLPALPGDGKITASALRHETGIPSLNYDRGNLTLTLSARSEDMRSVQVRVNGKSVPMRVVFEDDMNARYAARLPWNRKTDLSYTFALDDGRQVRHFGTNGLTTSKLARPFTLKAKAFKPFVVPAWVEKSVFYQIFPDRFENGDKTNDPKDVSAWDAKPQYFNRFGGDAAGVLRRIDHLSTLGVSSVYFNPVFQSPSNHRYDAEDFQKIDNQFGTNEEFAGLARELSKRGIRTVMDFVFNHTATTFAPFADVREKGAASSYKDWYFVQSYPVRVEDKPNYTAWYGFPSMPKLNVLNPPTQQFLLGLVNYWDKAIPLSGMRLDVANEVEPRFWQALRTRAKSLDPEMWIVGEVWGDGSPWLAGDQWDSCMNYQFRFACVDFFAEGKTKPSEFLSRLMNTHESYAPQVSRNLMNLLSSHDTSRFLTDCKNDANLHRLAATVQFTWVGAPSIYYGEEIGMEGGPDPDNRRGMRWDLANDTNPMLRFYKKLIAARNASVALQSGDPRILLTNDAEGTLAYAREIGKEAAVVALNRSDKARQVRIEIPPALRRGGLIEALTGRKMTVKAGETHLTLMLPARASVILLPARGDALRLASTP